MRARAESGVGVTKLRGDAVECVIGRDTGIELGEGHHACQIAVKARAQGVLCLVDSNHAAMDGAVVGHVPAKPFASPLRCGEQR